MSQNVALKNANFKRLDFIVKELLREQEYQLTVVSTPHVLAQVKEERQKEMKNKEGALAHLLDSSLHRVTESQNVWLSRQPIPSVSGVESCLDVRTSEAVQVELPEGSQALIASLEDKQPRALMMQLERKWW